MAYTVIRRRYCGKGKIRLQINAEGTGYRASVTDGRGERATVFVGVPAHITRAIDSREAFDSAAHAAVSFATNDRGFALDASAFEVDENGAGWAIRRSPGGKVVSL